MNERTMYLAFDIGCLECGEESAALGIYPTRDDAQVVVKIAEEKHQREWSGQHYFAVYPITVPCGGGER